MKTKKFLLIALVFPLAGIGFWAGIYFGECQKPVSAPSQSEFTQSKDEFNSEKTPEEGCPVKIEQRTVRGNSLAPFIETGQTVKILFGFYDCHPIESGDVVAYHYAGNEDPIIKIVKGLPGDSYQLKEVESGWNILVNGNVLKNSENQAYLVTGNRYKMLSLYEDDCKNGIPQNTYLILGNITFGSTDSTRFGLIGKQDILGKVEVRR